MKKIKYTPDAADKLLALKSAISGEYGGDKAKKIIKSITDAIRGLCDYEEKDSEVSKMFDVVSDYRYVFVSGNYVFYRIEDKYIRIINFSKDHLLALRTRSIPRSIELGQFKFI